MKFHFLFLFLLLARLLPSQSANPVPAYYVTLSGDTIRADINLDSDEMISREIKIWVTDKITDRKTLAASEVLAVGFYENGRQFRSLDHDVPVMDQPSEKKTVRRLARLLIDDRVQLYQLRVSFQDRDIQFAEIPPFVYYLKMEDGTLYRLEQEERRNDRGQFQVIDKYKGVLKFALRDWDKAGRLVDGTPFSEQALTKLVIQYLNDRYPNEARQLAKQEKKKNNTSSEVRLLFSGGYQSDGVRGSGTGFGAGFFLQFRDPAANSGLVIGLGAELMGLSGSNNTDPNSRNIVITSGHLLRLPVDLKYLLSQRGKVQPFVNGGLSLIISSKVEGRNIPGVAIPFVRYHVGAGLDVGPLGFFYRRGFSILNTVGLSLRPKKSK